MSRKVDYFVSKQEAPSGTACIFVALDAGMVPALLRGCSTYLSPAVWVSELAWYEGYQKTLEVMEALLMECGGEIVNNLIALRGIDPAAPRDPATGVPLAPPQGSTLLDLFTTLQTPTGTPGAALAAIQTATEATAANVAEGLGTTGDDLTFLAQLLALI